MTGGHDLARASPHSHFARILEAISVGSGEERTDALRRLEGTVSKLRSKSGCWLLQNIIELLPAKRSEFVAREIAKSGEHMEWAFDSKGHRVLVRLLQWTAREPWTALLLYKLTDEIQTLCKHKFGRHVAIALLAETPPGYKEHVHKSLEGNILSCVHDSVASTVIVVLLRLGDVNLAAALRAEGIAVYGDAWRALRALSLSECGRAVVDAALGCVSDLFGEEPVPGQVASPLWKERYPNLWAALKTPCRLDRVRL